MNWFVIIAGTLYVAGAVLEIQKHNWPMVGVLLSYAAANCFLAWTK